MIGVENKTVNRPNDSVVGVEKGRETDQSNENKGDQGTDNEVSNDDMSEFDKNVMNFLQTMFDNMNKRFDEMDKKWDQLLRKPRQIN